MAPGQEVSHDMSLGAWGQGQSPGCPHFGWIPAPCHVVSVDRGQPQNVPPQADLGLLHPWETMHPKPPVLCPSRDPTARAAPSLSLSPVFVENRIKTPCSWAAASRGRLWPSAWAECHQTAPSGGREDPEVLVGGSQWCQMSRLPTGSFSSSSG